MQEEMMFYDEIDRKINSLEIVSTHEGRKYSLKGTLKEIDKEVKSIRASIEYRSLAITKLKMLKELYAETFEILKKVG